MTDGSWSIREIRNPNHNHSSTIAASHPSLRKIHLTPTIVSEIERATQVNLKPSAIVDSLRLAQGSDFDNNQPTYKTKDIYNVKADLRRKKLGGFNSYSSTYAKIKYFCMVIILNSIFYFCFHLYLKIRDFSFQKDTKERVTHLHFTKDICETKLKVNPEILIMDCTYKSNKYRLPLLNVVGTTCLNTTFYVTFGFLLQERKDDFI